MKARLTALLLMTALALTLGACSKSQPTAAPASPTTPTPANPAAPQPAAPTPAAPVSTPVAPAPASPVTVQPAAPASPVVTQPAGAPSSLKEETPFKDAGTVREAIAAPSVIHYHVINIAAPAGIDKTAYLDQYLASQGAPDANDLLLLIFPADRGDIRFAMGSVFRQKSVTPEEMLQLVRTAYLPLAVQDKPEEGLATLVRAVNDRMK